MILHTLYDWTATAVPIELPLPGLLLHWRFIDLVILAIGLWILWRMFRESKREDGASLQWLMERLSMLPDTGMVGGRK